MRSKWTIRMARRVRRRTWRNWMCLLVEDDADLLEALAMTFEAAAARARSARSAAEALAAFGEQHPDVVIGDIAMPDRDGLYLVSEIRKLHGHELPLSHSPALPAASSDRR